MGDGWVWGPGEAGYYQEECGNRKGSVGVGVGLGTRLGMVLGAWFAGRAGGYVARSKCSVEFGLGERCYEFLAEVF